MRSPASLPGSAGLFLRWGAASPGPPLLGLRPRPCQGAALDPPGGMIPPGPLDRAGGTAAGTSGGGACVVLGPGLGRRHRPLRGQYAGPIPDPRTPASLSRRIPDGLPWPKGHGGLWTAPQRGRAPSGRKRGGVDSRSGRATAPFPAGPTDSQSRQPDHPLPPLGVRGIIPLAVRSRRQRLSWWGSGQAPPHPPAGRSGGAGGTCRRWRNTYEEQAQALAAQRLKKW